MQLIADMHYEIPVAMHLRPASHSEQVELRDLAFQGFEAFEADPNTLAQMAP